MASMDENEEYLGFYARDPKTKRKCVNWGLLNSPVTMEIYTDNQLFFILSYLQIRLWLKKLKKWRRRR